MAQNHIFDDFIAQFPEFIGNVAEDDRFVLSDQNGGFAHEGLSLTLNLI
jgi:hypothetical protein